ncbi:MAG: hypothetical protein JW719_02695 [Pirellulales bacterium]|nr:hypothetical protein [Pirellulales bacterium]
MVSLPAESLPIAARRRGRRLAYWNGGLWAAGNGLASTPLIVYLALELDAPRLGLGLGLILAAPNLVGVLRMAAPMLVERLGNRKGFCAWSFVVGAALLAVLPAAAAPGRLASPGASLAALIGLWCAYHLAQYFGTIALWSWLADLVPARIRGRFLGRRERWMVLGQAVGMVAAGLFAWWWTVLYPDLPRWLAYVPPMVAGVGFMLGAVVPLTWMPPVESNGCRTNASRARKEAVSDNCEPYPLPHGRGSETPMATRLLAPFRNRYFRRLLLFGCWFSLFNGINQSAMNLYQARVLLLPVIAILALKTFMRLGQVAAGPAAGRLADRWGNRPVLMVSVLLVAQGPLFYLLAAPAHPWWIVGAWVVWIAYVGLNVALPNLMLKLAPAESNLPYISVYYTVSGLCYAASTIVGGLLCDRLAGVAVAMPGGATWDGLACLFFAGWILRMFAAVVLLAVVEPKPREGCFGTTDGHR